MKIPECQECGACCVYYKPHWIQVTEKDAKRIGDSNLIEPGDIRKYAMKSKSCDYRCIAFHGAVGGPARCGIYDKRPAVCREVKRGGPLCLYMLGFHRLGRPW